MSIAEDRVPSGALTFECQLNDEYNYKDRLVATTSGPRGIHRVYLEAQQNYVNQSNFTSICVALSLEDQIRLRDWLSDRIEEAGGR